MGVASPNMEVLCPLLTIPHKITFGDVCGDPDFGTPPPLRRSSCLPARRRKLRRLSVARLLLSPFRFGHLGTCLICPLFGHFKHVPKCPKLQYKLLSFASCAFLYGLCLHFCHFCLKPCCLLAIPSLFFFFACYIFADL